MLRAFMHILLFVNFSEMYRNQTVRVYRMCAEIGINDLELNHNN